MSLFMKTILLLKQILLKQEIYKNGKLLKQTIRRISKAQDLLIRVCILDWGNFIFTHSSKSTNRAFKPYCVFV